MIFRKITKLDPLNIKIIYLKSNIRGCRASWNEQRMSHDLSLPWGLYTGDHSLHCGELGDGLGAREGEENLSGLFAEFASTVALLCQITFTPIL